jgi:hypothetical protein
MRWLAIFDPTRRCHGGVVGLAFPGFDRLGRTDHVSIYFGT